jgi:hypothetical protein
MRRVMQLLRLRRDLLASSVVRRGGPRSFPQGFQLRRAAGRPPSPLARGLGSGECQPAMLATGSIIGLRGRRAAMLAGARSCRGVHRALADWNRLVANAVVGTQRWLDLAGWACSCGELSPRILDGRPSCDRSAGSRSGSDPSPHRRGPATQACRRGYGRAAVASVAAVFRVLGSGTGGRRAGESSSRSVLGAVARVSSRTRARRRGTTSRRPGLSGPGPDRDREPRHGQRDLFGNRVARAS